MEELTKEELEDIQYNIDVVAACQEDTQIDYDNEKKEEEYKDDTPWYKEEGEICNG